MALKTKYTKREDIPKGSEEHYVERDGEFFLDADFEDVGALKRAKDYEAKERKRIEGELATTRAGLQELETELEGIRKGSIPKADFEKLETTYKKKQADRETELTGEIETLRGSLNKHLVEGAALKLAGDLTDSPALLLPHIRNRLKTDKVEGEYRAVVLDASGQPTGLSIDDLKAELLQNKEFAPILRGSRASGGGSNTGGGGGGAANPTQFNAATGTVKDLVAAIDSKKQ